MKKLIMCFTFGLLLSCGRSTEEIRSEWQELVKVSNYCESNSDCTFMTPGCPLGCSALTNSAEKNKLESKAKELREEIQANTSMSCNYSCVLPENIRCEDRICVE